VFERGPGLAEGHTGHDSGVVHAGIYYAPGSLKARLCRRGVGLMRGFCAAEGIAYEECGKLVVATREEERPRLEKLPERATANGVLSSAATVAADRVVVCAGLFSDRLALASGQPAEPRIVPFRGGRSTARSGSGRTRSWRRRWRATAGAT
jgi:L-2-hydroxyglutarate oxidase LhgO